MQKTETYQFNLIEGSDPFSQEPINENTLAMETILAKLPRIQTGSYKGTGACGEEAPNSLTFDFIPKAVLISSDYPYYAPMPYLWGEDHLSVLYAHRDSSGTDANLYQQNRVELEGSTMRWYLGPKIGGGEVIQLNAAGHTYRWVAVG